MRAGIARRLGRGDLTPLPLWREFLAQLEAFGDVWVVCAATDMVPLDDKRAVFLFERELYELALQNAWNVTDATKELVLDATARRNRARKPPRYLELPPGARDVVLAELSLDGDGVTSPRGVIAVLTPATPSWRGVWPHSKMHPFDRVEDPCRWPTIAVIDDARLAPDRTWSQPQQNPEWQAVAKELRQASERVLATIGEVPEDALSSLRINNAACANVAALRKAPKSLIRGVLWLTSEPGRDVGIQVMDGYRVSRSFVPDEGLAIGGKLVVYAPDGLDINLSLGQLCGHSHGKLVRELLRNEDLDADLVAAHVAHALFVRTVRANDVRKIEFPCFSPRPLDARALTSLFRREDPVTVIKSDTAPDPDPDTIELVDDGSVLARTIIKDLDARVRRVRPAPQPRPVVEEWLERPLPLPKPAPKPAKVEKPEPPHPLRDLVRTLRSRLADLGIGGYRWVIVERAEPMFAFSDEIELAGDNVRLRALAAAVLAKSAFASAGIDVVVAHLVTVLNVALEPITDAKEAHAIGVLLANRPSAGPPRSRRSS
jgi:hypothetical protein